MDIELIGKTMKGKNKIRGQGKFARVHDETDRVFFSQETGPWLFIKPHNRWVHKTNDPDFIVKEAL